MANLRQQQAAHESGSPVLLVAGPGTGKSATVEERIAHLVAAGAAPACADIADRALAGTVATVHLFAAQLPTGMFTARQANALTTVAKLIASLAPIQESDVLSQSAPVIEAALVSYAGRAVSTAWTAVTSTLPADTTMRELRDHMWSDNDEQQGRILASIYQRLGQTSPPGSVLAPRVRVMSMHGAKGLSAGVVFVPGLEEELLPGRYVARSSGCTYEAARLLYVALTRAKAACVISYATRRGVQGKTAFHHPSQFAAHLGGAFAARTTGLTPAEAAEVTACWNLL